MSTFPQFIQEMCYHIGSAVEDHGKTKWMGNPLGDEKAT